MLPETMFHCSTREDAVLKTIVSKLVAAAAESENPNTPVRRGTRITPPPSPVIVTSPPRMNPPNADFTRMDGKLSPGLALR
jgi:hypothetical protein